MLMLPWYTMNRRKASHLNDDVYPPLTALSVLPFMFFLSEIGVRDLMARLVIESGETQVPYCADVWRYREWFLFLGWRDVLARVTGIDQLPVETTEHETTRLYAMPSIKGQSA